MCVCVCEWEIQNSSNCHGPISGWNNFPRGRGDSGNIFTSGIKPAVKILPAVIQYLSRELMMIERLAEVFYRFLPFKSHDRHMFHYRFISWFVLYFIKSYRDGYLRICKYESKSEQLQRICNRNHLTRWVILTLQ